MTFTEVNSKVVVFMSLAAISSALAQNADKNSAAPASTRDTPKAAIAYNISNLGTLAGNMSVANAINSSGQVVGASQTNLPPLLRPSSRGPEQPYTPNHAFLYADNRMQDLSASGNMMNQAFGINASGQIVGDSATIPGDSHAFVYSDGKMRDIGTLSQISGGYYSSAKAVNKSGQVVGWSAIDSAPVPLKNAHGMVQSVRPTHAFLYSGGKMKDLGAFGGYESAAESINDSGQVVGYAETPNRDRHAFLYINGTITDTMLDLGTLGGNESEATAINNFGQIVGFANTRDGNMHAFQYHNGKMEDIGALDGSFNCQAEAINSAGQIVGFSVMSNGIEHAFLYSDGRMQDLNTIVTAEQLAKVGFVYLARAYGINDHGQIVGFAKDGKDNEVAFLLTPHN